MFNVSTYHSPINDLSHSRRFIIQILGEQFPGMQVFPRGEIAVTNGSATLFIHAHDSVGVRGSLVTMNSPLVHKLPMTPDLLRWVAVEVRTHDIGGVYVAQSGDAGSCEVWLGHSVVSLDLDAGGVIAAVYQLLVLADELDDRVQSRFGGIRFNDSRKSSCDDQHS